MLHRARDTEGEIDLRRYALAGLADLVAMRLPAELCDRTAAADSCPQKISEFMELRPFFFRTDAAAACNDDLRIFDRMAVLLTGDDLLQHRAEILLFKGNREGDDLARAGSIGLRVLEDARADRADLRTIVRRHDICHDIPIHRRTRPDDQPLLGICRKLRHICRDAADELCRQTRGEIAAEWRRTKDDGIRLLLQEERRQCFLVRFPIIVGKERMIDHIDLICAEGDQRGCRILEIGTDEDDCDLFPQLVSQYAGFAGQFTGDLLDLAIRKRSDDINTFIFRKIHFAPP